MTPIPTLLSELDALAAKAHPHSPWPTFTSHEIAYYHALCDALPLLRAEILRLREALEPFATAAEDWEDYEDGYPVDRYMSGDQTVGDLRRARAALKGSEGGE